MKRLLLLLFLPASISAMDKSWQQWFVEGAIYHGKEFGKQLAWQLTMQASAEIQQNIQDSAHQTRMERQRQEQQNKQQEEQNKQKEAVKNSEQARVISEEQKVCTEFDTCLNNNFNSTELTKLNIPRRCNSPARRYSLYNALAAEQRIQRYRKERGVA